MAAVDWNNIQTVLLDMDGTLLDKHFDDYFWLQFVPENYSLKFDLEVEEAKRKLYEKYRKREGTLEWTDLDFWSNELGLDIPALKIQVDHLIQIHPYVIDFLKFCKTARKKLYLVTNAHSKTLQIKMRKTAIGDYFDSIVCSQDVGIAKEDPAFWKGLHAFVSYERESCLLADDTEAVLHSACEYGIRYLVYVARPSSRSGVERSSIYPSITYFKELIPPQ